MALKNIKGEVVDRPKALGDIRGVTYIYGMFYRFGLIDVRKLLITAGVYESEVAEKVKNTFEEYRETQDFDISRPRHFIMMWSGR